MKRVLVAKAPIEPWIGGPGGKRHTRRRPAAAVKLQAVLFDLDNTLLDFMRMKRMASDAAARAMVSAGADFPFGSEEAGDILFGKYLSNIEGDTVFEDFLREHHQQKLTLSQHNVDKITAAAVNAYLEAKRIQLQAYPTVKRTLLELARRGLRMGVLTDAPRFKAYQRLDATGLTDFFEFVVTACDHGSQKPAERTFHEALDLLGLRPQEVLMVGDWPERDIEGAKGVGMRTAFAAYGRPGEEADADHRLERFSDLLKVTAFLGT